MKHFGPWYLSQEMQKGVARWTIRRHFSEGGAQKIERLPTAKYRAIRSNEAELQQFVLRLNAPRLIAMQAKESVQFKHAFINDALLSEFKELLLAQIPSRDRALTKYSYLLHHFLSFFISKLNLSDPLDWYQLAQTKWANYLLKDTELAPTTLIEVVQVANRFIRWLHGKRPAEMPLLVFRPISDAVLKKLHAERRLLVEKARIYIPEADLEAILCKSPPEVLPLIRLSLQFGLRRSEAGGLKLVDIRMQHLAIERQVTHVTPEPQYSPLKGREARRIPYWYGSPAECYNLISQIEKHRLHPDTISDLWRVTLKDLGMAYDFHALRHTFITKALRDQTPRDVQLAAGHKDIQTTMKYAHDDRVLSDEPWVPLVIAK